MRWKYENLHINVTNMYTHQPSGCCLQSVSALTWQRGGRRLATGGTQELDMRGMKPASLPLFTPSLEGKKVSESPSISSRFSSK